MFCELRISAAFKFHSNYIKEVHVTITHVHVELIWCTFCVGVYLFQIRATSPSSTRECDTEQVLLAAALSVLYVIWDTAAKI